MLHEPCSDETVDNAIKYKTKIGVRMFLCYGIVYAGFVVINIWKPLLMEKIIFSGLNLATVYGFGLIIFALVLALIYNAMCTKKEKIVNVSEQEGGK